MAQFARKRRSSFRSLYSAIVKLCRPPLNEGVAATKADNYVKLYPSADFALAMIFHFILGLKSLRELAINLTENKSLKRLVRMRGISTSHLPKLLHDRPPELWATFIECARRDVVAMREMMRHVFPRHTQRDTNPERRLREARLSADGQHGRHQN